MRGYEAKAAGPITGRNLKFAICVAAVGKAGCINLTKRHLVFSGCPNGSCRPVNRAYGQDVMIQFLAISGIFPLSPRGAGKSS
ncbi:hypothetical protein D9M69_469200 [compost metagenome]